VFIALFPVHSSRNPPPHVHHHIPTYTTSTCRTSISQLGKHFLPSISFFYSSTLILTSFSSQLGIGLATAHYLLSHSHKLVLIARTHSALDQLHYQYGSEKVEVLAGDVADPGIAKKAVGLAVERWGRLDGLVVNHGTLDPVKKISDGSVEEWRKAFDVNVFSAVGLVSNIYLYCCFCFHFASIRAASLLPLLHLIFLLVLPCIPYCGREHISGIQITSPSRAFQYSKHTYPSPSIEFLVFLT
jgi:hypothetical protein